MKKSYLFIMCGAPGSGKSYFIKHNRNVDGIVVSRDKIRFSMLSDGEEYFSKEKAVFKEFVKQIQKGLDDGKVVYADATHLNGVSRLKLLNHLNLKNTDVIPIFFKTSLETCLARNAKREGRAKVPEDALKNMYNSMTSPSNDEEAIGHNLYKDILYVEEERYSK